MPSPSLVDLKILNLLPNSIEGFIRFAVLSVAALIAYKIYEKRRWS